MGLGRGLNSLLGGDSFEEKQPEASREAVKAKKALSDEALVKSLLPPINKVKQKGIKPNKPDAAEEKRVSAKPALENKEDGQVVAKVPDELRIWNVRVDKIKGNKEQPRKVFTDEQLLSLSTSITEKGILQPITVRRSGKENFEIIAGERRWRAAQLAGLQEVPIIIKEVDDETSLELALIENIQREDLNPVEEAEAYFHLIKKYKMTQQQLAEKIGKERATVANVLRLLNLSPEVRKMVASCEISLGQAKALMGLSDPKKQKAVAIKARDTQMSVRAVEKLVAKYRENKPVKEELDSVKETSLKELKVELQRLMGTKVNIDYKDGKGKLSISFYSDNELNEFVDKARDAWKK